MEAMEATADLIGIKTVEDELFKVIENNPQVKKYCVRIQEMCAILMYLGTFFFAIGVFAVLLYKNKIHLLYFGLICICHIVGGFSGWIGVQRKNRYLLFVLMFLNLIWLGGALILLVLYTLGTDIENKRSFNREILLHVGCAIYIPLSIMTGYWCLMLVVHLGRARSEGERMVEKKKSEIAKSKMNLVQKNTGKKQSSKTSVVNK